MAQKSIYKVELNFGLKKYEAKGETIIDCFNQLVSEDPIKGYAMLKVKRGDSEYQIRLNPLQMRRFLINKVYKQILEKRFLLSL